MTPTTSSPPPAARLRRMCRPASALLAGLLLAVAVLGGACGSPASGGYRPSGATPSSDGAHGPSTGPASAAAIALAAAAGTATAMYRADIGNATAAFVGDIGNLQTAVDGGDAAAAKSDELAAQAQYDAFRLLESGNAVNASSLDELATDVDPGGSFAGLHAVERDLWSSAKAAADVVGHAAQAPVAQYLLSRDRLAPEAIGTTAVDGRIFAFGSTGFSGSMGGQTLSAPVVGIGSVPSTSVRSSSPAILGVG